MKRNINPTKDTSGDPCISIIVPTFRISPGRKQNGEMVRKAINKAKMLLSRQPVPEATRERLNNRIEEWGRSIDHRHTIDGVGLCISAAGEQSVVFPFPVPFRVMVGKNFETRDINYLKQFMSLYYILVLNRQSATLLEARSSNIAEVSDENFPTQFEDEYEYERSSIGSSHGYGMKAFEKDKGELAGIRTRADLKTVDEHLSSYLLKNGTVFVLAGTVEVMGYFASISQNLNRLAGKVAGSFGPDTFEDLRYEAWSAYSHYFVTKLQQLIEKFNQTPPALRSEGIQEVWKAATEGKGRHLLVEKDFSRKAYLKEGASLPYFRKPMGESVFVPDIVDDIIETVLEKQGEVTFLDNGSLAPWGHIAMLHRYQ